MADPNQPPARAAQRRSLELALEARAQQDALNRMLEPHQCDAIATRCLPQQPSRRKPTASIPRTVRSRNRRRRSLARGKALDKELGKLKDSVYDPNVQHKVGEDSLIS